MRHEVIALPQAPTRRFALRRAGELEPQAPQWIVYRILERDSLALGFGDPAVGKSFWAIDLVCSVATGHDYHGHKVRQSPVIYIAGEGQNGLARRLQAWSIRHGIDLSTAPLYISNGPAALCDALSVAEVMATVDALSEQDPPGLVVLDTVARNFGPGDENSTQDMTAFIAAAEAIRTRYGCTVLLIHHTGHTDKTRARGAMALKGALDAEYRLEKDEAGVIRVEATKMKDAPPPEPMAFQLRTVELPLTDDEGEPVSSAVLDAVGYEAPERPKGRRGKWQKVALDLLQGLYQEHQENRAAAGYSPDDARVTVTQWREACLQQDMPKSRFYDVRDTLAAQSVIRIEHGYVYLTESGSGSTVRPVSYRKTGPDRTPQTGQTGPQTGIETGPAHREVHPMTFALLTDLGRAGVRISANGDRLQIEAPAGAITAEQRQALTDRKTELLSLLAQSDLLALITAAVDGLPISPLRVLAHMTVEDRDDFRQGRIGPLTIRDYAKSLVMDYGADHPTLSAPTL